MQKVLITLLFLFLSLVPEFSQAALKQGEKLPEIAGKTINGEPFSSTDLNGKPFILKLGTTW